MAKSKVKSGSYRFWTVVIYVFLLGAVGTYFLPFVGVQVPVLGEKSWSVRDIVKTIPKIKPSSGEQRTKFSTRFDFMDFVKEIAPRGGDAKAEKKKLTVIVLGALIPIALVLAYTAVVIGLFLAPLKKGRAFILTCVVATVSATYVFVGIHYVNAAAQQAFNQAISQAQGSPFFLVTKHLVQEVSIQPAYGLVTLLVLGTLLFATGLLRMSKAGA